MSTGCKFTVSAELFGFKSSSNLQLIAGSNLIKMKHSIVTVFYFSQRGL